MLFSPCGESGIRTRDTLLAYTRFPGVPLQPLEHLSFPISKSKRSQITKKIDSTPYDVAKVGKLFLIYYF